MPNEETPKKSAPVIEAIKAAAEKAEIPQEKLDRALTAVRSEIDAISEALQKLKPDAREATIRKIADAVSRLASALSANGGRMENLAKKTKTELIAVTGVALRMQEFGGIDEGIKDLGKMPDELRDGKKDVADLSGEIGKIHADLYFSDAAAKGATAVGPRWKQVSKRQGK